MTNSKEVFLLNEKLRDLLLARKDLLERKPHLVDLQYEIDLRLAKAGSQHNRMVLMQELMRDKLVELQKANDDLIEKFKELKVSCKDLEKFTS